MGKIKLNLVSGAIVEKPLICAFKANNFEYIVLDNEMNGSMGLPIILVCKLENGKLIKIADQNEWQIVKEYLKNIIAGSQVELIKVASEMPADDIYYTQLTLPLPSFDALKSAYTIETDGTGTTPVAPAVSPAEATQVAPQIEVAPVASVTPTAPEPSVSAPEVSQAPVSPVVESAPVTPEVVPPVAPEVAVTPEINVTPEVSAPVSVEPEPAPAKPGMSAPTIDLNAPIPTFEEKKEEDPVVETPAPEPVVTPTPEVATPSDNVFQAQKEAFMQACENMFDALVQKFERELENRK